LKVSEFCPAHISFTYEKSFDTYFRKDNHPTRRKIYTVNEIGNILNQYGEPDDYCEMQVWSDFEIVNQFQNQNIEKIS